MTMPKSHVKEGMHSYQLFDVRGGYGLGDQPQQWWRTFEKLRSEHLGFDQHPMDPCVFILREPSSRWNKMHDDVVVTCCGDVGPPGSLCGILGVHVDHQVNGGRGTRGETAMKRLRASFPFEELDYWQSSQSPGWNSSQFFVRGVVPENVGY